MPSATDMEIKSLSDKNNLASAVPRSRFKKFLSLGLNDTLFSVRRTPWIFFDFIFVFSLFHGSVLLSPYGHKAAYLTVSAVFTASFVAFGLGLGFYDRTSRFDYLSIINKGVLTTLLASLASLMIYYFIFYDVLGRWTLIFGTFGTLIGVLGLRFIFAWILRHNPYRFTIIGKSEQMHDVVRFCGTFGGSARYYVYVPWEEILADNLQPSIDRLLAARIGDIVMTNAALNDADAIDFAIQALQSKIRVVNEAEFYTQIFERLPIDSISKSWVLSQGLARRQIATLVVKRWLDIILSALALILLFPFLTVIALIIKMTSPGPVFFNQPRQGRYSQPFKMYKFRTMQQELSRLDAGGGFTKAGDLRVTRIGRVLRPAHLDELPQLWNIFRGHMSIVGPRPEALTFARKMRQEISLYELRYMVRPGLTGHAQVNQGYAMDNIIDTKEKLSYDLYYLCYHSLWLDMQIILKTIFVLTKGAR